MRAPILAMALVMVAVSPHPAVAQKQGGTLRMYLWDNPPSASIHEEATVSTVMPFMAVFNNLVLYDQHKKLNTHGHDPARARHQLGVGRRQDQAHLQAARGREMARRQAVHGQGRRVHPGQAAGQGRRQLPQEPAQDLVAQPEGGDGQRRPRGDLPSRPAAALVPVAVRHRLHPGLSLPRVGGRHAHQADRHRPLQVRRVQEQRVRSSSCATPTTGARAIPTSTPSTGASSPTARRACSPSSPASST